MVTRTLAPTGKGFVVSMKHPPGPRSVVRVENLAPELSSTTSADAVNMWRSSQRLSSSLAPTDFTLWAVWGTFFALSIIDGLTPVDPRFAGGSLRLMPKRLQQFSRAILIETSRIGS